MQYLTPKFWRMTVGFLVLILVGIGVVYGTTWYQNNPPDMASIDR